jgi:hypothetical protein
MDTKTAGKRGGIARAKKFPKKRRHDISSMGGNAHTVEHLRRASHIAATARQKKARERTILRGYHPSATEGKRTAPQQSHSGFTLI